MTTTLAAVGWMVASLIGSGALAWGQTAAIQSHQDPAQISPTPATAPNADPALWKVQGPHETVYLFGTVHVMKPDVHWQTKKVIDAFGKSDTVYLEIAKPDDMASAQPMVMQLGLDRDHPLSTKISPEDKDSLDTAVKGLGLPGEQVLEPMRPWLAYMTLSVLPMMKSGYSPTSGVDVTIATMAKDGNKPVVGFETLEQQLHYFADLPETEQVTLLHEELKDLPGSGQRMNEIVSGWEKGDVDAIARMENEAVIKNPELFRKLVVERNQRFADELAKLLAGGKPGTVFVAIGAAHLAGPGSVQKDLEAKGYKVTREE